MSISVAEVAEIQPGERRFYQVSGIEIAVINVDGEYYAIKNYCPHMEGPVGRGPVECSDSGCKIVCPFHDWQFDLESGESRFSQKEVVTYDVTVESGEIHVDI